MILINLIFFVLLNLMLLLSARLIMNFLPGEGGSRARIVLGTMTLFFSLIVLIEIVLGVMGILTFPMVVLVVILLTAGLIFHQRKKIIQICKFKKSPASSEKNDNYYLMMALFAPALTLFAFRFFDALFQIPFDFDAISYHLPIVVDWMQNSSVLTPYYSAFTGPVGYYPGNVELLYLWTMLPLSNDFFVNLLNFPIYGLFIAGIYAVCRNFNFSRQISLVTAAIALYIPVFMHQAGLIFVDLFFILAFILGIFFLQEIGKRNNNNSGNIVLAGLAFGLFVGTKYLGIVYVILPVIVFLWLNRKNQQYWTGVLQFFVTLFLSGGYFYLRNWLDAGNPIYPAEVSLGGLVIFHGYGGIETLISGSSIWSHLGEIQTYKQFLHNFLLIGDFPGVLIMLGLVFSFFHVFYRILKGDQLKKLWLPILLLVSAAFYLLTYIRAPFTNIHMIYNIRYAMPLIVTGIINWAYLLKVSERYQGVLFAILLLAMSRAFIYAISFPGFKLTLNYEILSLYQFYFGLFLLASLILFFVYPLIRRPLARSLIGLTAIAMLGVVVNFAYQQRETLTSYYTNRWYPAENMFWGDFQAALWFNKNDEDARIAYSGFDFHYHLFGRNLKREVDYVNVNDCLKCSFRDYDGFKDLIRHNPNFEDWQRNLEILKKEYLVLRDKTLEYNWVKDRPQMFEFVDKFKETYIFRINYDQ